MYKLYTDKKENFEAQITLEGASLNNSFARLILESQDMSLIFKGDINSTGKVNIPISGLKNILKEGTTGKLELEVIADDTYFSPWSDNFELALSKKMVAEVKTTPIKEESKPKMDVQVSQPENSLVDDYFLALNKAKTPNQLNTITENFIKERNLSLKESKELFNIVLQIL